MHILFSILVFSVIMITIAAVMSTTVAWEFSQNKQTFAQKIPYRRNGNMSTLATALSQINGKRQMQ